MPMLEGLGMCVKKSSIPSLKVRVHLRSSMVKNLRPNAKDYSSKNPCASVSTCPVIALATTDSWLKNFLPGSGGTGYQPVAVGNLPTVL
ncbi:MAG TPA: hypothetical protein VGN23_08515 [Verrucomicrobiae bacterium]|jgi:hypothetical protein